MLVESGGNLNGALGRSRVQRLRGKGAEPRRSMCQVSAGMHRPGALPPTHRVAHCVPEAPRVCWGPTSFTALGSNAAGVRQRVLQKVHTACLYRSSHPAGVCGTGQGAPGQNAEVVPGGCPHPPLAVSRVASLAERKAPCVLSLPAPSPLAHPSRFPPPRFSQGCALL